MQVIIIIIGIAFIYILYEILIAPIIKDEEMNF
jgi:hypothetical protein